MSPTSSEIIFEVSDDEVDGGFSASALGYGIHTQAETIEEMRDNIREAVECYFDDASPHPPQARQEMRSTRPMPLCHTDSSIRNRARPASISN